MFCNVFEAALGVDISRDWLDIHVFALAFDYRSTEMIDIDHIQNHSKHEQRSEFDFELDWVAVE
jgi:hypothetical protein